MISVFNSLKDKGISEKHYRAANNIWNVFEMNTMGNYHDFYLKTNVLLLVNVFEKSIKQCLDHGLGARHYFSSPRLIWDAMVRLTRIELDLIPDIDMHLFIEKGMTGGVSYIAKRHSREILNTWSVMTVVKKVNTLLILMQINYMVRE